MIIYPAIDLINGKAVRLSGGNYNKKTTYSEDPVSVAANFVKQGAECLHIVDLDGAKAQQPVNNEMIKKIANKVDAPIQLGGGIRNIESAAEVLQYVERVILGTVAVTEPLVLKQILDEFGPEKVVVSVDYKDAEPAINGWLEGSDVSGIQLKRNLADFGIKTVIITDVERDGMLAGPNVGLMKEWKEKGFEVICAGGVTTSQDLIDLKNAEIDGAIIGKALYENKIKLKEAIDVSK